MQPHLTDIHIKDKHLIKFSVVMSQCGDTVFNTNQTFCVYVPHGTKVLPREDGDWVILYTNGC